MADKISLSFILKSLRAIIAPVHEWIACGANFIIWEAFFNSFSFFKISICWDKVFWWTGIAESVWRLATSWTGWGSNPGWGEISRTRLDRPWGPPSLLHNGYRVSCPGLKRPGRGINHPTLFSAEVKERVELYLYSPSGPSWPVLGRALPLPLPCVSGG